MADEKILKEEILSDDELDNVAGGNYIESAVDAKKFKELGVKIYDDEILGVPVLMHDQFEKLRSTFKEYGVTIKDNGGLIDKNQYFIGDTEVTRETAWAHVESQLKK